MSARWRFPQPRSNELDGRIEKMDRLDSILDRVRQEVEDATAKFPAFNSAHEGYAVIQEEVDELWADVKANRIAESLPEALQVAAMAVRYIIDISHAEAEAIAAASGSAGNTDRKEQE